MLSEVLYKVVIRLKKVFSRSKNFILRNHKNYFEFGCTRIRISGLVHLTLCSNGSGTKKMGQSRNARIKKSTHYSEASTIRKSRAANERTNLWLTETSLLSLSQVGTMDEKAIISMGKKSL